MIRDAVDFRIDCSKCSRDKDYVKIRDKLLIPRFMLVYIFSFFFINAKVTLGLNLL